MARFYFICLLLGYLGTVSAVVDPLRFTLHKLESDKAGPTLLVIGGIQGDEPGGFNAASLLVTDYRITRGAIWVVPNLNFASIIRRSRGIHGDMNRKFAHISLDDPEFDAVQAIKAIILDKQVDMILNLHDGSGFYRKKYVDRQHSPRRWGQSIIIDQAVIAGVKAGDLQRQAEQVVKKVNRMIGSKSQHFAVKNTHTSEGNGEMEKTLTYFAIRHRRPAFGIEASKSFLTHERTRFHLQVVEAFMHQSGISFTRPFKLNSREVKQRIDNNVQVALYHNRILLDVARARPRLSYVPMKKNSPLEFSASNPLVAVIAKHKHFQVRYGNRRVTRLVPQYFDFDDSLQQVEFEIDGKIQRINLGTTVKVMQHFKVMPQKGYRTNVIGYSRKGLGNESGVTIKQQDIMRRFSVDKRARLYRVEFYRAERFCGMVLVNFSNPAKV